MVNINNLALKSNGVSSGVSVVCSSNTGLTEFDISVNIENVYMNDFSTGVLLDAYARECRLTNIRCYYGGSYGGTGFNILGTDNFIERCTAAQMNYKGFYFGANNKVLSCKAFICGKITGDPAFHITNYCNLTNICAQQNCGAGLYVEGDSNSLTLFLISRLY